MDLERFARQPLLFGPSPVQPLRRLSDHLGGGVEIWAKREDCNSGLAFGGNKVRKLEYLAADALAQGADTLVSIGGVQSNHTRQVAAVAAHLGMRAVLVQEHWVDWPDAVYDKVGNILLSRIMGADVRLDAAGFDIGIRPSWEEALESVRAAGGQALRDPGRRVRPPARRPRLRQLGDGGGAPGAGAGHLLRHDRRVLGDRVHPGRDDRGLRRPGPAARGARHRRVRDPRADAGPGRPHRPPDGRPDRRRARPAGRRDRAARRLPRRHLRRAGRGPRSRRSGSSRRLEGMLTDPVYEGKSMAGLIDLVRTGQDRARARRCSTPTSAGSPR